MDRQRRPGRRPGPTADLLRRCQALGLRPRRPRLRRKHYLYYGSYFGGLSVRELTPDGLESLPETQEEVAIPNRYEGAEVVQRDGHLYLFASATNCCNGDLTGYSVFVGRATSPTGPFVDREGVSLLDRRVGGPPVISMNGNRWVGTEHNAVVTDFAGQW